MSNDVPNPRLSVVLVVHREQAYIEECTASVLDQGFEDVELVAIDDASPDHGPALLDELAGRDPRVRVRHLPERAGLGAARNLGLEMAGGDYVWFARTTDRLPSGALAAVADRLAATSPDVLVVHHSVTGALRETRPGPGPKVLARTAERGTVTIDQQPGIARFAPRIWSLVFRRAFLEELGARFGAAGHSELTVTWPALLAAERIAALQAAAYDRREPGNAVHDRFVDGSPFDVFAQHDAAFERELPEARRRLVTAAQLRHELGLLEHVPAGQRREFFRRMSERLRRHPTELKGGGRARRLRTRLVERDAYLGFRMLERALGARHALGSRRAALSRQKGRVAARARRARLERHYRARMRRPIDPNLAVFAAYWYRGYSCNPRAIYEKARELVPGLRGVWVVNADAVDTLPEGVEHVVAGTPEYYDVIARAGWFVNNVNFPNHLVKRAGQVHVMTHHGTPLKTMGLDLKDAPSTGRTNFGALLRRCARWDYSVSSNEFSTLVWERVYPTRYESLETGYPRNDVLAAATGEDVERIRAELGIEPGQKVVLYAPTHREYQADYEPVLDVARLADGLGTDYVILARQHYFHAADTLLGELHREGRVRDVAAHPSVEELCLAADALVTDYSSIMFDYAVLDRPIVVHAPDWEVYRAMRGTYFDLMEEPPGAVTRTTDEVISAFRSGAFDTDEARRARAAFRPKFCSLEDGRAAERVVRRVWLGEVEQDRVTSPEPPVPETAR
jgi:CDP-glycerol glycerophosphotransferase